MDAVAARRSIIIQNYVCMGVITLIWVVWGFSLCFGASGWFYGDPGDFVMLNRVSGAPLPSEARGKMGEAFVDGIPGLVFCAYQGMFAVITQAPVWKSTSASGAPSSRRRVDGVEIDAAIQDKRAVNLISAQPDTRDM